MKNYTSKIMRSNPLFMRNQYKGCGKWDIPIIKKQCLKSEDVKLIAYSDIRLNDNEKNRECGVHFFIDDYRFEGIYRNPERSFKRLSQYAFVLTPDYSTYADMDMWRQLESIVHSRWCGAYWQSKEMLVIPTISWSTPRSFEFCFEGIEKGSTVAVGMIGCKHARIAFMRGYNKMLERLEPENIIVFGKPFSEMDGNIIRVDYEASRKVVH